MNPASARKGGKGRAVLGHAGFLLLLLLPLWLLWLYAFLTLHGLQGGLDRLPRFYGMHLYKQAVHNRLTLFVKVMERLETEALQAASPWPEPRAAQEKVEETAGLFGLDRPLLLVKREGLEILYPSTPQGDLAMILRNAGYRQSLFHVLGRMTARGLREAYCSLGPGDPSSPAAARWYLVAAPSGQEFLWVLLLPEKIVDLAADHLASAQQALVEESLNRFLLVTLPFLLLSSLGIGFAWGRRQTAGKGLSKESPHEREE